MVQVGADSPDDAVVLLGSYASEASARKALYRQNQHQREPSVVHQVRTPAEITRYLEWDPEVGHGVIRHGPPPPR